jgi:hypothetical protein
MKTIIWSSYELNGHVGKNSLQFLSFKLIPMLPNWHESTDKEFYFYFWVHTSDNPYHKVILFFWVAVLQLQQMQIHPVFP